MYTDTVVKRIRYVRTDLTNQGDVVHLGSRTCPCMKDRDLTRSFDENSERRQVMRRNNNTDAGLV